MNYRELLKKRRSWYKEIKKVYCPSLGVWVAFNSQGFKHLRYHSHGKMRSILEVMPIDTPKRIIRI